MFIINPEMTKFKNVKYDMGGYIGYLTGNVINEWLLEAPFSNPGMLEIFNDRNRKPLRDMIPWAGEFAGKHLTSAVQVYALTRDEKLGCFINWFVDRLFSLQDSDGYIGCWPDEYKLSGNAPNAVCIKTWDAWAHYHIILGLILWYRETGYEKALDCAEKIGDLLCSMFLNTDKKLVDTGNEEMNLAPIHGLCLLYEETGDEKYLEMAFQIEREFEVPHAGDYVRTALSGVEFYMTPKPRWESLHSIQGIAELYFITGNEKYLKAFENIWW
ncbi:MAG: glycoside hydrolase family 127 protein, partial [Clostridiales bacterium]|nr:glycoside hydrolase family 127 protein [Clostridiales bacterium]